MTEIVFSLLTFSDALITYPRIEVTQYLTKKYFARIEHFTRCEPQALTLWNPVRGIWRVEAGVDLNPISITLGHISDHQIGSKDIILGKGLGNESFNYFKAEYRIKIE